ncbi:MAG: glycine zipper 2TM domain-containing protein [Sulfuricurvum sp.]|nr:glycine zipper 2TM domain-containing protein [Sulfuricurvum sp.]
MKRSLSLSLILCILVPFSYAQAPSSVIIDGVEYAPVPKTNTEQENYTIPQSSLGGTENCWYEQVAIPNDTVNESPNMYGAIVGGIIGGVIGHQFGSGSGKTAATIGGAALGTALGSTPQTQPQRYQTVRKCNTSR